MTTIEITTAEFWQIMSYLAFLGAGIVLGWVAGQERLKQRLEQRRQDAEGARRPA